MTGIPRIFRAHGSGTGRSHPERWVGTCCSNFLASLLEPSPGVLCFCFTVTPCLLQHHPHHPQCGSCGCHCHIHSLLFIHFFMHSTHRYFVPDTEDEARSRIWPHMELPLGWETNAMRQLEYNVIIATVVLCIGCYKPREEPRGS